uniref:Neurotrophin 4 n=1 Tax=Nothobranchius rachovii TaxID=451742 RepID=A0A1A8PAF4_9TELE
MESQITYQAFSNSGTDDRGRVRLDVASEAGTLRTGDISKDNSLQKDYKADGSISRKDFSRFSDFSKDDTQQDFIDTPVQASTAKYYDVVSPATMLKGQRQPEPTVSSRRAQLAPSTRTVARTSAAEDILTVEAGMDLGAELDGFLKGDEIFLDSHPRNKEGGFDPGERIKWGHRETEMFFCVQ